jgi:hypothetical protein
MRLGVETGYASGSAEPRWLRRDVVGASPYLNRLAKQCALATDDVAVSHPSEVGNGLV